MSRMHRRDTVTTAERSREFWRRVLLAGTFAAVPRWTREPATGEGECEVRIPGGLVAELRRRGDELAGAVGPGWVAPPGRGAGAPSGGREALTGVRAPA